MSKSLREDITGLRAIAVVSVALFHMSHIFHDGTALFQGGFLGVDIFFVISGYLMTLIIMSKLDINSFSFIEFYSQRAKRICPALFVVVLVSLIVGFILLQHVPLRQLFRESVVSLLFVSNFRFARAVDYFDEGDISHILLHSWSLSVEWQFYIFYPLILFALKRCLSKRAIGITMLASTLALVLVSVVWTGINARQSYYLLPSRACELLFGSLAYFYSYSNLIKNKRNSTPAYCYISPRAIEITGLACIIASLFLITNTYGWPTYWLILPMIGTYLCIAAENKKSILSNVIFQKLGLWSYAIYLVHWPILIFASALGFQSYAILLFVIIASAISLHYSVERRRDFGKRFLFVYIIAIVLIYMCDKFNISEKIKAESTDLYEMTNDSGLDFDNPSLFGKKPEFILHGDSHSMELTKSLVERNKSFIINPYGACYSLGNHVKKFEADISAVSEHEYKCNQLYTDTRKLSKLFPDIPVVIIQNWTTYGDYGEPIKKPLHVINDYTKLVDISLFEQTLQSDILQIARDFKGRKIFIVGKKQENPFYNTSHAKRHILSSYINKLLKFDEELSKAPYIDYRVNRVIKDAIKIVTNKRNNGDDLAEVYYIEPAIYCENNKCDLFLDGNIRIYSDRGHYSWAGAERAVTNILNHLGIDPGQERTSFTELPDIDFKSKQTVLEYSPETGFKLPDSH